MNVFIVTALLTGVALFPQSPPVSTAPRFYDIVESPEFTAEQANALHAAEQSWMTALPGELRLRATVGECPENDPRADAGTLICIAPVSTEDMLNAMGRSGVAGVTVHTDDGVGPWWILLDVEWSSDPSVNQGVAAHEIGHAMGLGHSQKTHTLMYPAVSRCDMFDHCIRVQSVVPTPTDVAVWRHIRVHA